MKITAFFLLVAALHLSAAGLSQGISLSLKNAPPEKLFAEIHRQAGFNFVYSKEDLARIPAINIEVKNSTLDEILNDCLLNTGLAYTISDRFVVIRTAPPPTVNPLVTTLPPNDISGQVTDEPGTPLSGVTVINKATGRGTVTDVQGRFLVKGITEKTVLVLSSIGYATREILVGKQTYLIVRLRIATNELDKTVVQAYGTTSHRLTTSDIAVVTSEDIEKQPVTNPLQALQGRVAGLDVIQTSGYASAPFKVELRGRSAINDQFPSDPLYIIDGVPLTVLEVGNTSSYSGGSVGFTQSGLTGPANGQSPLFSLNPADIQSIEVLKDADATAIYGSRGANGVILITTKKGKAGKTKLDIHVEQGMNKVTRFWKLLNTSQYVAMREEAFKNDGLAPDPGSAPDILVWDTTRNVDWQKELYGNSGKYTDLQMGLSGGDARTIFRIGLGYHRQTAITAVSGADQRGSLSFDLTHKSLDQKFSVLLTTEYSFTKSDMISLPGNIVMPPDAPAIFDSAGNLNFAGWSPLRDQYPFTALKQPYDAKTDFLNSNLTFNYQPFRGLTFRASFGFNNAQNEQLYLVPIASQDPTSLPTGSAAFGNNHNRNWIIEPQITYDAQLGKGKLSALVGGSSQDGFTDGTLITGTDYSNDALLRTVSNAPTKFASDNFGQYRYAALFGRATYNWDNKYVLNLSARRDGSSKFGSGNQFGNFGAVGAAWIFSEEPWLKDDISWLSFGKLRGSYGTTGSDIIGDYQYLTRWTSASLRTYTGIQPLRPLQHSNPNYHWQVNKKLEAAVELGFLKDRFTLSVAYYRNRCGNQLIAFPTPNFTGFGNVTANSPALVENHGFEFNVSGKIIEVKNFSWAINFNTSINKNKLVAYPNFQLSPYRNVYVIGKPLNITKLLHYTGVDPQTGQYTFQDKNHDGTISINPGPADDRFDYDLTPRFFGGLGTSFTYKTLQLSLFFNIKKQIGINATGQGYEPGNASNQPVGVLARWQNPGDVTNVARFTTQPAPSDAFYNGPSDGGYTDASFIRLENLSLSYGLPSDMIKRAGMQSCTLFIHAENLFVITNYRGIDPETQNFGGLPPEKVLVAGISFSF